MERIVIATKNEGKVEEMREALSHLPVEVVSLSAFGDLLEAQALRNGVGDARLGRREVEQALQQFRRKRGGLV